MEDRKAERLGYLATRGLREEMHKSNVASARKEGFEDGIVVALQADDCPHDPDLRCSDFACGDGC